MKTPNKELLTWAILLMGGAVYLGIRTASSAPELQYSVGGLAAVLFVLGLLLLVRFRWSAELVAAVAVFWLLWVAIRIVGEGVTVTRVGLAIGALMVIFSYPELRRHVRNPA